MATVSSPSKKRYNVDAVRQHNERHEFDHNYYGHSARRSFETTMDRLQMVFDGSTAERRRFCFRFYCCNKKSYRTYIKLMKYDRVLPLP